MSYAQVAQHHKDALKEKKEKQPENISTTPPTKTNTSTSNHNNINSNNGRTNPERESRGNLTFLFKFPSLRFLLLQYVFFYKWV